MASNGAANGVFSGNPLSLSLGRDDFTQWVKHRKNGDSAPATSSRDRDRRADVPDRRGSDSGGRASVRFKTPYMTVDDLKKPPKPWREFLCTDHLRRSYSVPKTMLECKIRLDGNAFEYVGNYARMALVFGGVMLYRNPTAVVGAYASAKLYAWMDRNIAATSEMQALKMIGTIISWFVMMYTKASAAMSMTMLLTMAFLVTHGCLRRLDAPKPIKIGKYTGISKWETQSPRKRPTS